MKTARIVLPAVVVLAVAVVAYCADEARLASLLIGLERWRSGVSPKVLAIDGTEVAYLEGGQGEPVLFVHGFAADKDNWTRMSRFFTGRYHVYAIDLPGFGESTRDPQKSYDVDSQVERLHDIALGLGLSHFHLVGNSMGGQISAVYAARHPDEVLTLSLLDASGEQCTHRSYLEEALARGENPLVAATPEDYDKIIDLVFVERPYIPDAMKHYFGARAVKNREFNLKIFADRSAHPTNLAEILPTVQAPTLVLFGDSDKVIDPSCADAFVASLPHATKVIMAQCGHAPMLERPEETAGHIITLTSAHPLP